MVQHNFKVAWFFLSIMTILLGGHYIHAACSGCELKNYVSELKGELTSLKCLATKLNSSIEVLKKTNSSLSLQRQKQYDKIEKAMDNLQREVNILASECVKKMCDSECNCNSSFIQGSMGYTFSDGRYGISCAEYMRFANVSNFVPTSGIYVIKPGNMEMAVYCDMTTSGGGWTLLAGISGSYGGNIFEVFNDAYASLSTPTNSFHIPSSDLLKISTQIMAVSDSDDEIVTNFYTSQWSFGAFCDINIELRDLTVNPSEGGVDVETTCYQSSNSRPLPVHPTHFTYGKTSNGHPVGFRMGIPHVGYPGCLNLGSWATFSHYNLGLCYYFGGTTVTSYYLAHDSFNRNGALFLR